MSSGSWVDKNDPTHLLTATAGTPTVSADVAFGGLVSVTYNGTPYAVSTRPASAWRFIHDGTGCDVFTVAVNTFAGGNSPMWSTRPGAGFAEIGVLQQWGFDGTRAIPRLLGGNAAGSIFDYQTNGSLPLNTATYSEYAYSEAASPKLTWRAKTSLLDSGSPTGAPATGNSVGTFTLAALSDGSARATCRYRALFAFKRVLSAAERAIVQAYIAL